LRSWLAEKTACVLNLTPCTAPQPSSKKRYYVDFKLQLKKKKILSGLQPCTACLPDIRQNQRASNDPIRRHFTSAKLPYRGGFKTGLHHPYFRGTLRNGLAFEKVS
jgi:hypothetical protein